MQWAPCCHEEGHGQAHHKKKKTEAQEKSLEEPELPSSAWRMGNSHLGSSGNGLRRVYIYYLCLHTLQRYWWRKAFSISPANDITSVHFDFILVTWKWGRRKCQLIQVLRREKNRGLKVATTPSTFFPAAHELSQLLSITEQDSSHLTWFQEVIAEHCWFMRMQSTNQK